MKFLRAPIAIALSVLCLSACTPHHSADTARVSLMTYNVENLFDTVHDEGKDDYAYLPLSVKQAHPEYLATCTKIDVAAWRKECEENKLDSDLARPRMAGSQ